MENDLTYSLGWALAQCPTYLTAMSAKLAGENPGQVLSIGLQEAVSGGGFTDIEIRCERAHVIIEAKRGWTRPTTAQLEKYRPRISDALHGALVVFLEASSEYAQPPACRSTWTACPSGTCPGRRSSTSPVTRRRRPRSTRSAGCSSSHRLRMPLPPCYGHTPTGRGADRRVAAPARDVERGNQDRQRQTLWTLRVTVCIQRTFRGSLTKQNFASGAFRQVSDLERR